MIFNKQIYYDYYCLSIAITIMVWFVAW